MVHIHSVRKSAFGPTGWQDSCEILALFQNLVDFQLSILNKTQQWLIWNAFHRLQNTHSSQGTGFWNRLVELRIVIMKTGSCSFQSPQKPINVLGFFKYVVGPVCNRTWDGWLCWDDTETGVTSEQHCPDYFQDFDPTGEYSSYKV